MLILEDFDFRKDLIANIQAFFGEKTKLRFNKTCVTVTLDAAEAERTGFRTQFDLQGEVSIWLANSPSKLDGVGHAVAISSARFKVFPKRNAEAVTQPEVIQESDGTDSEDIQEDPLLPLQRLRLEIEVEDFVVTNLKSLIQNMLPPYTFDPNTYASGISDVIRFAYLSGAFANGAAKYQQVIADVFNSTFRKYAEAIKAREGK